LYSGRIGKGAKREEEIFRWSLDPQEPISEDSGPENARQLDPHTVSQAKNVLSALRNGRKPGKTEFDPDVRCYLLGLAPNAARLSLRLWRVNSFGELLSNVSRHYTDLDIAGMERFSFLTITISPFESRLHFKKTPRTCLHC
jgi:CRISPR-associated protein Csd1